MIRLKTPKANCDGRISSRCLTLRSLATASYSYWKNHLTQIVSYLCVLHTVHIHPACIFVELTVDLALDFSVLESAKVHRHLSPLHGTHDGLWTIFSSNPPSHYLSSTTSGKSRCMPNIHKSLLVSTIWHWVRGRVLDGDLKTLR
jgi:hypothetical protein